MNSGWRVRLRLVAVSTAAMAAILALGAGFLVWRVQHGLSTAIDDSVRQQALSAAAAVAANPETSSFPVSTTPSGIGQVVDRAGEVVAASGQIEGENRLYDFPPSTASVEPPLRTVRLSQVDGAEFRVAGVQVPGASGLTVYLGLPTTEVDRSARALATSLSLVLPVVLALLALLAWWYVGRALRPVDALLERLDRSLERQRQFVADAAHELRSPVTAIQAQVESPHPGAADPRYGPRLREEAARLSTLVDDLLALARLDAQPELRLRSLDLDDIVFAEATRLRGLPGVRVDVSQVRAVRVEGDPSLLTRAVRNLMDNAARHAAGFITVQLGSDAEFATLVISDDGPGIPAEHRVRVFERFTRLDSSRGRGTGGVGLGLAIAADVASVHGGTVAAQDNQPGARMVLKVSLRPGRNPGPTPVTQPQQRNASKS